MRITEEQKLLAEARGCRFTPASSAQLQVFAMQRRIFWQGEQALVAQREDGFYETAATLQQLLELPAPEPEPAQEAAEALLPAALPSAIPAEVVALVAAPSLRTQTVAMVTALLATRPVGPQDLPDLIRNVHGSLARLQGAGPR